MLVEPALESVEHGYSFWSGDSSAVRRGNLRWERAPNYEPSEISGVHRGEVGLGAIKDCALVVLEGLEIADALMDHFVDSSFLAVVIDRHLHSRLPLIAPDRHLSSNEHEVRVFLVRVVEERKRDGENLLALEMIHMLGPHGADRLVIKRMHRGHAPLERIEDECSHEITLGRAVRRGSR